MSSQLGLPQDSEQRPPLRRGVKELLIALAALPVLLAAGIYVGGHLAGNGSASVEAVAGTVRTPAPVVTVQPATPAPVVTVQPAAPAPVVTVQPAAPAPVVAVKTATPAPVATVRPAGSPTSSPPATPVPPAARPPANPPVSVAGPVAPARLPPIPATVLGPGSAGADVRAWQLQMARRHWRITVDGVFGPRTRLVVLEFQRIKGLRIDGLIGRQTWVAAWRRPVLL